MKRISFALFRGSGISRKKNNFLPLFLIISFFLLSILAFSKTDFFNIKTVLVEPEKFRCGNIREINQILNLLNQNYFYINTQEITNQITKKFLCIERVDIKKTIPDKIKISLLERKPAAIVAKSQKDNLESLKLQEASSSTQGAKLDFSVNQYGVMEKFLVDISGFVYSKPDYTDNLPTINIVDEEIKLGSFLKNGVVGIILDILNKLSQYSIGYRTIKVINDHLLIDADTKLVFSLKKDYYRQLAYLQLILQKAKMNSSDSSSNRSELQKVERIDLRFDKPIVIYGKR